MILNIQLFLKQIKVYLDLFVKVVQKIVYFLSFFFNHLN